MFLTLRQRCCWQIQDADFQSRPSNLNLNTWTGFKTSSGWQKRFLSHVVIVVKLWDLSSLRSPLSCSCPALWLSPSSSKSVPFVCIHLYPQPNLFILDFISPVILPPLHLLLFFFFNSKAIMSRLFISSTLTVLRSARRPGLGNKKTSATSSSRCNYGNGGRNFILISEKAFILKLTSIINH